MASTPGRGTGMAEERSPVLHNRSPSLFGRSPTYAAFSANNDELEKQQIRAAKAAVQRKALLSDLQAASSSYSQSSGSSRELTQERVTNLYQNCIKLAAENKINQKNTWDLALIDHITQIVKADILGNSQTNFQKASCTLEAGVKIYSYRVDSVHSETFKVLSGLNRTSLPDAEAESGSAENGQATEKDSDASKKVSFSSTLESSLDALNVKKFDAAYAVDPLFHQTSAQFDEGGASGLLLYNLGVSPDLRIMFDSAEAASWSAEGVQQPESMEFNVSPFAGDIESIIKAAAMQAEISPAIDEMFMLVGDARRKHTGDKMRDAAEEPSVIDDSCAQSIIDEFGGDGFDSFSGAGGDFGDDDDAASGLGTDHWGEAEGNAEMDLAEDASPAEWIVRSIGLLSDKENDWKGPKHWHFNKPAEERQGKGDQARAKRSKEKTELLKCAPDPQVDWSLMQRPRALKDINSQRTTDRTQSARLLPPKHSVNLSDLTRLYYKPSFGLRTRAATKPAEQDPISSGHDFGAPLDDDDDHGIGDMEYGHDDSSAPAWEQDDLVEKPRQTEKLEVTYAKRSKQVDVRALKETIWGTLHACASVPMRNGSEVSFKDALRLIPADCRAAPIEDISVHLCFISLLHLANENSLVLTTPPDMDEVLIGNLAA